MPGDGALYQLRRNGDVQEIDRAAGDRGQRTRSADISRNRQPISLARAGPQSEAERTGPCAPHGGLPCRGSRNNVGSVRGPDDRECAAIVSKWGRTLAARKDKWADFR